MGPPGASVVLLVPLERIQQSCDALLMMSGEDEGLLARAEEVLTEIKIAAGLSEPHEAVLAALRIRLRGDAGSSLEELLAAADDPQDSKLGEMLGRPSAKPSTTFDELLSKPDKPKTSLDDLLDPG